MEQSGESYHTLFLPARRADPAAPRGDGPIPSGFQRSWVVLRPQQGGMGREVGQAVEEGGEEGGGRPLVAPAAECAGPSTCRLASGAAFPGAATRRARAGRRSRCRRWTRAGGVRGRVHLQGPACAAGRDRGRVCASDSGAPRQGLLMAGSAAHATRGPDPCQSRPGGRSAGRKPHPAHASLWPHRPPLPQRRRTLFQPPRAPPGSRRPHQQATTRITGTGHRLERLAQHALHLHHLGTARTT